MNETPLSSRQTIFSSFVRIQKRLHILLGDELFAILEGFFHRRNVTSLLLPYRFSMEYVRMGYIPKFRHFRPLQLRPAIPYREGQTILIDFVFHCFIQYIEKIPWVVESENLSLNDAPRFDRQFEIAI